jgi:hypothetical protein
MIGIVRVVAVCVFALVTGFANAQNCASSAVPICGGTCPSDSVCRNDGSTGVPACACVIAEELAVAKLSVKLNFKKPASDGIQLQALVAIPDGYSPTGDPVVVDVGGVVKSFVLDEKGKAKTDTEQVKLAVKKSGGAVLAQDAKLTVKFKKGSFAAELADEGLVDATVEEVPVEIDVVVDAAAKPRRKLVALPYTAKQGSSGRTK